MFIENFKKMLNSLKSISISGLILTLLFLFSVVLYFSPTLQNAPRSFFTSNSRKILSVASAEFTKQSEYKVFKLLTEKGIVIELYGSAINGYEPLLSSFEINDPFDSFFQFKGRSSNLALQDMDGDNVFEIIAPSLDSSLIPHLNILKFNQENRTLEAFQR
jgi:hypothetical protein